MKKSLFAVLALALVAFAAGCGSKKSSESPQAALQSALTKTAGITSGMATVKGSLSTGSLPGSLALSGGGPFDMKAKGGPATDLEFSIDLAGSAEKFGIVAVDGKSYLTAGDKALEQKGGAASLKPVQISSFISGMGKHLTDVKSTGDNSYSATIDVKKLLDKNESDDDLSKLAIPGLGSGDTLAESVDKAEITVKVDAAGYAQVMDINLPVTTGANQGGVRATISLSEINKPVTIEQPTNVVSSATELGGLGAMLADQ